MVYVKFLLNLLDIRATNTHLVKCQDTRKLLIISSYLLTLGLELAKTTIMFGSKLLIYSSAYISFDEILATINTCMSSASVKI